jgi:hypothetical protein
VPDLVAGSIIRAGDFPPTVDDSQAGSYTVTSTTLGITTSGGTYVDCGVAFVAPTTGRILIHHAADLSNASAGDFVLVDIVVREGSTVGSGTAFFTGSGPTAIYTTSGSRHRWGVENMLEGLTPYDTYNVRLEHRVTAGTGTILRRTVIVKPAT